MAAAANPNDFASNLPPWNGSKGELFNIHVTATVIGYGVTAEVETEVENISPQRGIKEAANQLTEKLNSFDVFLRLDK